MKRIFIKSFTALCTLLIFHEVSLAQLKKDSSAGNNLSLQLKKPERPKTNEYDNRSVYKIDSTNNRMPVLHLDNNSRMPIAKLYPTKLSPAPYKPQKFNPLDKSDPVYPKEWPSAPDKFEKLNPIPD